MLSKNEAIRILKDDMELFFNTQCYLLDKSGRQVRFKLNETQKIIHAFAEKQLRERGKVRIVGLKGRQQGFSTYVTKRFLHKICYNFGLKALLMVHLHDAGKKLFSEIIYTYNNVHNDLKPRAENNNQSLLKFNDFIRSQISFTTAGSSGTGRSSTIQLLHGSEVGFWDNAQSHMQGLMQALANVDGSECFLESTAHGMVGNAEEFYNKFMGGLSPKSEFQSLFIPWFTNSEYQTKLSDDFVLQTHTDFCEKEYKRLYNVTDTQIMWMRNKIMTDFNGRYGMWCTEYPAIPSEAFEGTGEKSFIEPHIVAQARKRTPLGRGEKVLGIDVGGDETSKDPDRTVFAFRQGNDFKILREIKGIARAAILTLACDLIKAYMPDKVRIDVTGIGHNLSDDLYNLCKLRNIKAPDIVGVNFGYSALEDNKYLNVRAEMYHHLREALKLGACDDDAELQKDLTALSWRWDNYRRLQMEPKKNLAKSPDLADAMALCCHQSQQFFIGVY